MIDHDILKTDLFVGPLAEACKPLLDLGNADGISRLFNAPGSDLIQRRTMDKDGFLLAIFPGLLVLAGKDADLQSKWDRMLRLIQAVGAIPLQSDSVKLLLQHALDDGVLEKDKIDSITSRPGSRAEVLFGADSAVTVEDVALAMKAK